MADEVRSRIAPRYLLTAEAAELLRMPVKTLHEWRSKGVGPKARRVGKHLLYDQDEVIAWVESQAS